MAKIENRIGKKLLTVKSTKKKLPTVGKEIKGLTFYTF